MFYRHICSSCFTQGGKVGTHSASDCKKSVKKRVTLGMVNNTHLQPDHVQENLGNIFKNNAIVVKNKIVNNQYSSRFVHSHSVSDLNISKQEMSATKATWKEQPVTGVDLLCLVSLMLRF